MCAAGIDDGSVQRDGTGDGVMSSKDTGTSLGSMLLGAVAGAVVGTIVNSNVKGCYPGTVAPSSTSFLCTHSGLVFLGASAVPGFLIGGIGGSIGAVAVSVLYALSTGGGL